MSAICDGCRKAAMYTVKIGEMVVCEECVDIAKGKLTFMALAGFMTWMDRVDDFLREKSGLESKHLLVDFAYRNAFENEVEPEDAARDALRENGCHG